MLSLCIHSVTTSDTGQSIWPVLLSVVNLPPKILMNVDSLLLAGIWLGPVKPDMKLILQPVIARIDSINTTIKTSDGLRNLKAKLLLAVFDLPAKAMALNTTQFNGKYGCAYCLDEGIHVSHRRLYLPSDAHKPRKMNDMKNWASKAEQLQVPVFGVKGHSVLTPYLDVTEAVPIDYMHAILEGVTKSLINTWFDSKNHGESILFRQANQENG